MRGRFAAVRLISDITRIVAALNKAQDILADHITPDGPKLTEEQVIVALLDVLDDRHLLASMENAEIPIAIKSQALTLLKHNPPPAGADIEVSAAWFRMAQNVARYAFGHPNEAQMQEDDATFIAANPHLFDAGPTERGERSER